MVAQANDERTPMAIGDVLVRIRKERNLTQEDLARKLYVTRQAVSRWENGVSQTKGY